MPSRSYASSTGYQYGSAFNTRWRYWRAKFVWQVLLAISASTSSNMWLHVKHDPRHFHYWLFLEQIRKLQDVHIHILHRSSGTVYPATSYTAILQLCRLIDSSSGASVALCMALYKSDYYYYYYCCCSCEVTVVSVICAAAGNDVGWSQERRTPAAAFSSAELWHAGRCYHYAGDCFVWAPASERV